MLARTDRQMYNDIYLRLGVKSWVMAQWGVLRVDEKFDGIAVASADHAGVLASFVFSVVLCLNHAFFAALIVQ